MPFTPPPASLKSQPFSFIVYGDIQGNYRQRHDALVQRILQESAILVFHTGDISPDDGENYERHFHPAIEKLARRIPFFPAAGNHDVAWGSPFSRYPFRNFFKETFAYLGEQPANAHLNEPRTQKLWYSLVYGNSLFIVLDSNFFIHLGKYKRTHALKPYRNYAREQLLWVKKLLEESSRTHIRAKFIFFHHSPLVSQQTQPIPILGWGGHSGHREVLLKQELPGSRQGHERYLLDLFRHHGVTAVFTGHEHYYERWREVIRENGTPIHTLNWVVNGLGGVKPRGKPEYREERIAKLLERDDAFRNYLQRIASLNPDWTSELTHAYPTKEKPDARFHNYMLVTVDGSKIHFQTKDIFGKVRDSGFF